MVRTAINDSFASQIIFGKQNGWILSAIHSHRTQRGLSVLHGYKISPRGRNFCSKLL